MVNNDDVKTAELSEIKKHVGAIHINNKLSLLEHKIANVLLLYAYDEFPTTDEHTIRIRDLARLSGFDSNDHELLRKSLVSLAETSLQWNVLGDGGKRGEWGVSTMLAQAVIEKGICRYAYSPELRKKLYNPEIYARINLTIQQTFTSGYALKLYENCVRYRDVGSTGWWPIGIFKSLLGIGSDEYQAFKDLNKWVIKPGITQVNENSDIILNVEYKREKRKIIALRFHIKNNPQLFLQLSIRKQLLSKSGDSQEEQATAEIAGEEPNKAVLERLQQFGLSEKEARRACQDHAPAYIMENLDVVEMAYQAGKVKTLPAYTKAALKEDYRPKVSPFEVAQIKKKLDRKIREDQSQQAKEQLARLEMDFHKHRLQTTLDSLSDAGRVSLQEKFLELCREQTILRKWIKKGWESPVLQGAFRNFAAEQLLPEPTEAEFAAFVASQGKDLKTLQSVARGAGNS